MITTLSLVVLRCTDVSVSRRFYEALGLSFQAEQHGAGPVHYSTRIGSTVLELYPVKRESSRGVRLGLSCTNPEEAAKAALVVGGRLIGSSPVVIEDPDGHAIELSRSPGA
jgi:catechol 2,3-dioxygenase-like lactoylglutathione lyase family enzyme